MPAPVQGRFYDGGSARRQEVTLRLSALGLEIAAEDGQPRLWRLDALEPPERLPGGGIRLATAEAPGAQLVVEAPAFHAELLRLRPELGHRRMRWRRHRWEIVAVVGTVLLIVGGFLAIPLLSRPLAHVVPESWEAKLGDMAEEQLVGPRRVCAAPEGVAALEHLLASFRVAESYAGTVEVKVIDWKLVNAFAAPGGRVVLMRGLIEKAGSADEVAGVLAHELGHVIEHHPTANAIRQLGLTALLDLVLGDGGSVLDALGKGGALLLLLSYTRADEAAADVAALELLGRAGIDSNGFAEFFARLGAMDGENGGSSIAGFLQSHPAPELRRARAREAAGHGKRPALNSDQWDALKKICG